MLLHNYLTFLKMFQLSITMKIQEISIILNLLQQINMDRPLKIFKLILIDLINQKDLLGI